VTGPGAGTRIAKDLTTFAGWANLRGVVPSPLPFATRLWFAWVCFFRVLFDAAFAGRTFAVRDAMPELPPPEPPPRELPPKVEPPPEPPKVKPAEPAKPDVTAALQLLALLQREGRLVDFLEQDVAGFSDAEVGAAARVVHEGCRKTLRQHARIMSVRSEEEGAGVTIADGYDAGEVKLIGNVSGKPPYRGVLVHRGWRVRDLHVPTPTKAHDATVIAPAEVELS
jgi:Domain of unknown function (DUF2760)